MRGGALHHRAVCVKFWIESLPWSMFLRNERSLGVKNGTLGTLERLEGSSLTVRLDDQRAVRFDLKDYAHVDHGYAATIHKAQGVTVDRAHVLASTHLDRHA